MPTTFKEAVTWLLEHEAGKLSTWGNRFSGLHRRPDQPDAEAGGEAGRHLERGSSREAERVRICPLRDGTASKHRDGRSAEAPNVGLGRRPAGAFLKGVKPICPKCNRPGANLTGHICYSGDI